MDKLRTMIGCNCHEETWGSLRGRVLNVFSLNRLAINSLRIYMYTSPLVLEGLLFSLINGFMKIVSNGYRNNVNDSF